MSLTYIYIKLKTLFKAYIKKWVKPRNTLYLKQYFVTLYVTLSSKMLINADNNAVNKMLALSERLRFY